MSTHDNDKQNSVFTETELDDLSRSRNLRISIIGAIAESPANLKDPEMASLLLKAADGLDKAAMGGAKIRVSAKSANDVKSQMAAIVATMLTSGLAPCATPVSVKREQNSFVIEDKRPGEDVIGKTALSLDDIAHVRTEAD